MNGEQVEKAKAILFGGLAGVAGKLGLLLLCLVCAAAAVSSWIRAYRSG